jgi:predicted secreted hydrolase
MIWLAVLAAGAAASGWRMADPAYRLELPRDHASHPDTRIEWWYYTGNVSTVDGRRFGYQLTFFRVGVDREPVNPSRWAVRDLHMAHFAITDVDRGTHRFAERLNRTGIGWAGAATDRYEVWNDDWRVVMDARGQHVLGAADAGMGLALQLDPGQRWVRQGEDGYSRKGATAGNASHYYSLTRMATRGRLVVDGRSFVVEGLSWMDHEFGSSFLESGQRGWDWFSMQLDNGADVMIYQLRRDDGTPDRHSSGVLVLADGRTVPLSAGQFRLTPGIRWRSPRSGASYPVAWRLDIPDHRVSLEVGTEVPAQELRTEQSTGVTYWEGSVAARGTWGEIPVEGRGYLEMTGYAGAPLSDVLR